MANASSSGQLKGVADSLVHYWPLVLGIVEKIELDLHDLKIDSSFIKGKVSTIEKLLKAGLSPLGAQPTPGLVQAKSPLSLTLKGEEILNGSNFPISIDFSLSERYNTHVLLNRGEV